MSVCAVIPFLNEIETLKTVVEHTLNYAAAVVAVNDGSIDNSEKEIENFENVFLINLKENSGKREELKAGFKKAISMGFENIFTLDADLQHDPKYILSIIEKLGTHDIVIGNRLRILKSMPFHRILSNKITSFLLSIKTGKKILDSQCGFRGYRKKVIESVKTTYSGFESESEIMVLAAKNDFKIGFVDIPTVYISRKTKMRSIKTILGFLRVLINK